jgi:hypothetical protein
MNIKKFAGSAVTALAIMATATCFAQISKSDLNIGGIYYKESLSDVTAVYGQPIGKERTPPAGFAYVYRHGNSTFTVSPWGENGYVCGVQVKDNCPLGTKAGIRIGSTQAEIQAVYGRPDKIEYEGRNLYYSTGRESIDHGDGYSSDIEPMLIFRLDRAGGRVIAFWFTVMDYFDERYPTGSKPKTETQKSSQTTPSTPQKTQRTIPDFVTEIPKAELNIGGIEPGQDVGYTEQIYGKPGKFEDEGFIQIYNYNDKFVVRAKMNHGFKVTSVAIYEKGLKTPSGLTVGMPYGDVVKKFGKVNGIKFKGEGIEAKLKGCTDYTYFSGDKQAVFLVDKKGLVQAIRVEELDEQKYIEAKRKKHQA